MSVKHFAPLAAVVAILALPATAMAAVLDYDFSMTVTGTDDPHGIFSGFSDGTSIGGTMSFDSSAKTVALSVNDIVVEVASPWSSSSWSEYMAGEQRWAGGGHINGPLIELTSNGSTTAVQYATFGFNVDLDFGPSSTGGLELVAGSLDLRLNNSKNGTLRAEFQGLPPTQVPELDPKSGMSTVALLGGGVAIALSRRRRTDAAAAQA